jgi:hypothetical protein
MNGKLLLGLVISLVLAMGAGSVNALINPGSGGMRIAVANAKATPEPETEEQPAAEIIDAEFLVDGETDETFTHIQAIIAQNEDGEDVLFLNAEQILFYLSTGEMPLFAGYLAESNQVALTTKPLFEDGVALRELLTGLEYEIDGVTNDEAAATMTVSISKGRIEAVLTLGWEEDRPLGVLKYKNKTAEFEYYLSGGSTYIIEPSFLQAMEDVGL